VVTESAMHWTLASSGAAPSTVEKPSVETETEASPERLWNVIVWNDPINLMSYVTFVFQKLFGYSLELATRLMLEVHHEGRSIVASVVREKAEYYVGRLHQYGLQATLEKQTA
jgi:ATP-dependent Clp protease adaptor protein ClpS